jgi:hypothetical protein
MNTDFDELIEHRVRASLERTLAGTPVSETSDAVWSRVQHERRSRRRSRAAVSMLTACALLVTLFGVYRATDTRKQTIADSGSEERVRLLPTWTPDYVSLRLQDGTVADASMVLTNAVFWREGSRTISVAVLSAAYVSSTREAALKGLEEQPKIFQFARWAQDGLNVQVSIQPPLPVREAQMIVRSMIIDPAARSVSPASMPAGYSEVFRGEQSVLQPLDSWFLFPIAMTGPASLVASGVKRSRMQRELFGDQVSPGATLIETIDLRGHKARLTSEPLMKVSASDGRPGGEPPEDQFGLFWTENGWDLTVGGSSREDVVRFARGLKDATDQEWADFPRTGGVEVVQGTPSERQSASNVAVTIDTGAGEVSVRAAELVTAEGCVNLVFIGIGADEQHCVKPKGTPVLWSGVRKVGGQKVVLAVVDESVDSVILVRSEDPARTDIVSSLTIEDTMPAGAVVDLSQNGSEFQWIGFVALPFEGDNPGQIEAFTNAAEAETDQAQDTIPLDESNAEPVAPDDTREPGEESDVSLRSLGRFPVDLSPSSSGP